ncbi:MAG: hypothetical protein CBC25_06355 [Pelagibacteraceae bacterium TMED65]|nr:hypothetical protein [Rickettsiales bacterium]OUU51042.1 MAG: hypothetical protein CBC25_06355 [Pelagibacteraceae bacterium TMED65]
MIKFVFTIISLILCSFNGLKSKELVFASKTVSNFYMSPNLESPVIYPIDIGKEMVLIEEKQEWMNLMDKQTGLVGWSLSENFSLEKPKEKLSIKNYEKSFEIFKERVLEMSKSIKEAISIETFIDVEHLGGAAAAIIADDEWFKGRRHANQAFQVYELWKNQNQSPSFLSFRNSSKEEQFIILSGPHRPRYLKSSK